MNQKTGKLIVGGVEVSAIVGDMQSRATLENVPSGNEFTIMVKSEDGSFERTLEEGVFSCILPVGTYTVEAAYGEDKIATDKPYFCGSASVEIKEGMTESISVTASLQSAIIRAVMDEELLAQYEDYTLWISEAGSSDMESIDNDKDIFVPAGDDYLLRLTGTNLLGDDVNTSWELKSLSPKTRYIVSCDADLPSFTFPEQAVTNAWSKFIYITPMTAENMTSHPEKAQQVMDNIVYEASADNGNTWMPAEYDSENEKWVIKGLQPSTAYTLRSRFGGVVSSNTQAITTENAQELENGDMEDWTSTSVYGGNGSYSASINCDYCTGWSTRNERTTDGAENANGNFLWNTNYATNWKWCSGTVSTSDSKEGNAAEISTLGLYNQRVSGVYDRNEIESEVKGNGTVYVGYLLYGTYDLSSDTYTLGKEHLTRPVSMSFDYKYAPVEGDQCIAYAKLYDAAKREIASTEEFRSGAAGSYTTSTLRLVYTDLECQAACIGVFFQSGTDNDINKMTLVEGSHTTSPHNRDRIVGSVLKVDNVKLNYEYE
ncbi:DUF4493 domain-containing protein [Phocaeicola sp. Sa1CVN1]|uniref:DUF4493 domain-containing protein n=2 Tax=Phocaeicola intestinalis TaxID=2762212 RepID=A0ABR8YC99_9BACT|nr:DUF4493 domain-containing protein [Phocaeicola intestinalis]